MARDLKIRPIELVTLAKKGPIAADLLQRLLVALGVDVDGLERDNPLVLRDLERLCTTCDEKRQCELDLVNGVIADNFRDYCPNAFTLDALLEGQTVEGSAAVVFRSDSLAGPMDKIAMSLTQDAATGK